MSSQKRRLTLRVLKISGLLKHKTPEIDIWYMNIRERRARGHLDLFVHYRFHQMTRVTIHDGGKETRTRNNGILVQVTWIYAENFPNVQRWN